MIHSEGYRDTKVAKDALDRADYGLQGIDSEEEIDNIVQQKVDQHFGDIEERMKKLRLHYQSQDEQI